MAIDTSIDEFYDERLQRVLGAPPVTAEADSWYPGAPTEADRGSSDQVPHRLGRDDYTAEPASGKSRRGST